MQAVQLANAESDALRATAHSAVHDEQVKLSVCVLYPFLLYNHLRCVQVCVSKFLDDARIFVRSIKIHHAYSYHLLSRLRAEPCKLQYSAFNSLVTFSV